MINTFNSCNSILIMQLLENMNKARVEYNPVYEVWIKKIKPSDKLPRGKYFKFQKDKYRYKPRVFVHDYSSLNINQIIKDNV